MTLWRLGVVAASKSAVAKAGYTAGGTISPSRVSTIQRMPFSTESFSLMSTNLSAALSDIGRAGCESSTAGYVMGGDPVTSVVEKLTFSTQTNASLGNKLSGNRRSTTGWQSSTDGYVAGGVQGPSSTNIIEKMPFSTDVMTTLPATLNPGVNEAAGCCSSTAAYMPGGIIFPTATSVFQKLTFSTDARSTITNLTTGNTFSSDAGESTTAGYIMGGITNPNYPTPGTSISTVVKLTFSDESQSSLPTGLDYSGGGGGSYASTDAVYNIAGRTTVVKFNFSNDSRTTLTNGRVNSAAACAGYSQK